MRPRAYSEIGTGVVRLGNAWFERAWSAFTGGTVDLTQQCGDALHWAQGDGPEFRLSCAAGSFGIMDLGDAEWSEEVTPHAAGLFLRKHGPERLEVHIRTRALHQFPGQLRTFSVYNAGESSAVIDHVLIDALPMGRSPVLLTRVPLPGIDCIAAWTEAGHGVMLGILGEGRIEPCAWDSGCSGVFVPGPGALGPGQGWTAPETCLVSFSGKPEEALAQSLSSFLEQVSYMADWERNRALAPEKE